MPSDDGPTMADLAEEVPVAEPSPDTVRPETFPTGERGFVADCQRCTGALVMPTSGVPLVRRRWVHDEDGLPQCPGEER